MSFFVRGLNLGVDFQGGRSYIVRFEQSVRVVDVQDALTDAFGSIPEVKTFGTDNQVRIVTKYKIDDLSANVDNEVEENMYIGLKEGGFISDNVSYQDFTENYRLSSQKIGPTVSNDIKRSAVIAVIFALAIMFIYIMVRFSSWKYGLGSVVSLTQNTIITIGFFSIFNGILPFSLEVDQAFIAAILTVIAYSLNDTIVVFDRIRENLKLYPKRELDLNMNHAINSTLRRTLNTSCSTIIVLLVIFVFGGANIRGFIFAIIVGISIGVCSSVFIASPIVFEVQNRVKKMVAKAK